MWPSSAAAPTAPRYGLPSRIRPPPIPVPSVSITMWRRPAARAERPFRVGGRVRVVVDPDRQVEAPLHPVAEVELDEREIDGDLDPSARLVDRPRDPEADRADPGLEQAGNRLLQSVDQVAGRRRGRRQLRLTRDPPLPIHQSGEDLRPPEVDAYDMGGLHRGGYHNPPDAALRRRKAVPRLPRGTAQGRRPDSRARTAHEGPRTGRPAARAPG